MAARLQAWDWNHDGAPDLSFTASGKLHLLANLRSGWKEQQAPQIADGVFCDFQNLGVTEICSGGMIHPLVGASRKGTETLATGDFNGDGRLDAVFADTTGAFLYENVMHQ